jgi:hypothetical protein
MSENDSSCYNGVCLKGADAELEKAQIEQLGHI